ncbi:PE-PGRS family protein [Fibrivirga algicola]|jgi:hypothetical protein|uniref:PE-PGRS family protein n=1 Tax=Fibrivirga algicola TaxID=2950420 RepID=A0ABX0QMM7_9BACT|nr:PE-PGRS family protein [Fibrivirga algicola]NID13579.1 PE-PGRS family protein [Fibrivirga algicola]
MMHPYSILLVMLVVAAGGCTPADSTGPATITFASVPLRVPVEPGLIDEASGLADSRTMDGHLWVEEDSGNPAQLNLLTAEGKLAGRLSLPGVANRDWEDIAVGLGPQAGLSYLYLADIGDNGKQNDQNYIYRLVEPKTLSDPITAIDRIAFRYADGPRDAEAILLDPLTRDLWIVTKESPAGRLYHLPFPQSTSTVSTATFKGEVPLSLVTSGSISPDGQQILLKTYVSVSRWPRAKDETINGALLKDNPAPVPYQIEPQGEAIAFDKAGNGFYTLSERASASSVTLNYYKRQ